MENIEMNAKILESSIFSLNINPTMKKISSDLSQFNNAKASIKNNIKGKSIVELSQNNIMSFPILMCSDIPADDALTITKTYEKYYAILMNIYLQNTFSVDANKYQNFSDYISSIHQNDDSPNLLKYFKDLSNNIASATEMTEAGITQEEYNKLYEDTLNLLSQSSLNDLYRPNISRYEENKNISKAFESSISDKYQNITDTIKDYDYINTKNKANAKQVSKTNNTVKMFESKNSPFTALNVSINYTPQGSANAISKNFIVGIKGTTRLISPNIIFDELNKSLKNNELAFKIIQWTKGELSFFKDMILDINNAKNDAISSMDKEKNIFSSLRNRKINANKFIGTSSTLTPISTLVITDIDVTRIKAETGMDLYNPTIAHKLISNLYLLGFCIYNTSTKICSSMMNTDTYFSDTTIKAMKNNTKDDDSVSFKDLALLLGKR